MSGSRPLYLDKSRFAGASVLLLLGTAVISWVIGAMISLTYLTWRVWRSGVSR